MFRVWTYLRIPHLKRLIPFFLQISVYSTPKPPDPQELRSFWAAQRDDPCGKTHGYSSLETRSVSFCSAKVRHPDLSGWRRERDSNPRTRFKPNQRISNPSLSTTQPSLRYSFANLFLPAQAESNASPL